MKINEIFSTAYSYAPSAEKVVKSALTMAVSAAALEAISSLSGAEAGPVAYFACVAACSFAAAPVQPLCYALCAGGAGPWCA